jgi:aryl-alcohol dehydrogenase
LALELGAQVALDPGSDDVVVGIRAMASGGVDFVLNTTTLTASLLDGQRVLAARGVLGFVSATREPFVAPLFSLLASGQSLRGIVGGDAAPRQCIPLLLDYWRQGRFPVDRLVQQYPFEKIAEAFAACRAGTAIKPVLQVSKA